MVTHTLTKDYDRNVMNKYRLYLLLGAIIFNLIDYISICTDAELFISFCRIIYIYGCLILVNLINFIFLYKELLLF